MLRRPSSMDMASWTIFSLLDKEFAAQIRLACVFGNLGNEALIVTKDDEVCPSDIKLLSNKKKGVRSRLQRRWLPWSGGHALHARAKAGDVSVTIPMMSLSQSQ